MYLTELALTNFRSYNELNLTFEPGVIALTGPNGVGKTNLLEAINFASTLISHRVSTKAPLIAVGSDSAIVQARIKAGGRSSVIELELKEQGSGKARINRGQVVSAAQVRGILRAILFAPEDLSLVKGDPEGRRRFLDELIMQAKPVMAGTYRDFERVLRHRNALLRTARQQGSHDVAMLEIITEQLVKLSAQIMTARIHIVQSLNKPLEARYQQIASQVAPVALRLVAGQDSEHLIPDIELLEQSYALQFGELNTQELARGQTLVGPQRDDVFLGIGDLPAKGYASHGESWSLALALKLSAFDYLSTLDLNSSFNIAADDVTTLALQQPVLLLDDVFAELDTQRRENLSATIKDIGQVFVTSAIASDIPSTLGARIITVSKGQAKG